jgi:hypothetical protein
MKLDRKSTLRAFGALCAALSIVTGIELTRSPAASISSRSVMAA